MLLLAFGWTSHLRTCAQTALATHSPCEPWLTTLRHSLGPWTQKALEASRCAVLMDAGQAQRYLRAFP